MATKEGLTTIGVYKADKVAWVQLCKSEGVKSADKFRAILEEKKEAKT